MLEAMQCSIILQGMAGKPELILRVGTPVSSLCKSLIYDEVDLGLSFRLVVSISDMYVW